MGCLGRTGGDGRLSHWTMLWTQSLVKLYRCIQKKTNWEKKKKRGYRRREKRRFRRKNGRWKRPRRRRKKSRLSKRCLKNRLLLKKNCHSILMSKKLWPSQRLGFRSLGRKSGPLSWTGYWNSPQKPKTDGFLLRQNSPQWSYSNQKTSKKWKGRWPEIRKNWKISQARTVKYSN